MEVTDRGDPYRIPRVPDHRRIQRSSPPNRNRAGTLGSPRWADPAGSSWREDFRGYLETNNETSTSIYTTMTSALGWLNDPEVAALATATPDEQFDVPTFISSRGTLYLLGSDRPYGTVAPLFTCLTAHIFETAKALASQAPGGRLDPYLTLVLDEAPLICPVPLDRWTADAGGRGIPIHIAAQSRTQLYAKWGELDGRTIWSNAAVKLIFGGIDDERELQAFADLCGQVDEDTAATSEGPGGAGTTTSVRQVPVMPPERIRGLKRWQVLLIRRGMAPAIGRITPVWVRRDVKAANRAIRSAPATATAPTAVPAQASTADPADPAAAPSATAAPAAVPAQVPTADPAPDAVTAQTPAAAPDPAPDPAAKPAPTPSSWSGTVEHGR